MAWLSGYAYRQKVSLARTDGAVSDYQMKLNVHKGAGDSLDDDCYLKSHALSWTGTVPNDIRFTKADGSTELDYWIESSDANNAVVWMEFDSIGTTDTDFYIYYGKVAADSGSNGGNTFPFFDNFETYNNGDLNAQGDWDGATEYDVVDSVSKYGSKSVEVIFYASPDVRISKSFTAIESGAVTIHLREDVANIGNKVIQAIFYNSSSEIFSEWHLYGVPMDVRWHDGTGWLKANDLLLETWYKGEIYFRSSDDKIRFFLDGIEGTDGWTDSISGHNANLAKIELYVQGAKGYYDAIIIRNYTDPEPTWGAWGSEETPAAGWTNIAKVSGVAAAAIGKMNSVLVADIAKVNGVAV